MTSRRELAQLRKAADQRVDERNGIPEVVVPEGGIVEFATSPQFLGVELFPLQATILKVFTLAIHLFTRFDYVAIERWGDGFRLNDDPDQPAYRGRKGTTPDLIARIESCLDAGRSSCEELVLVLGRRGSKSFLAAIIVVWRLWNILALGDPQAHYRIPPNKKLIVHLFAADQTTLVRNGYGDVINLLQAPCFEPYLGTSTSKMTSLLTPAQLARGARPGADVGNVQVVAAPTTSTAIRGPAVPVAWLDEFGHVNGAGSTADSVEIYTAAMPSLSQFTKDWVTTVTPLGEQVGQASSLVGLLLALDALFTLEQSRRSDEELRRVGGPRRTTLRTVSMLCVGLAVVTGAAIASLTPLFANVMGSIGGSEWDATFAVFGLTYLLLIGLLVWQVLLARRARVA